MTIIIHIGLLVAKIKSCICDKEGNNNIIIARALCDLSFNMDLRVRFVVRIWVPDDDHSTHARTPHALFFDLFVNRQNGSRQSPTIDRKIVR